jgi:superfamily II DNA or RNA helicase
MAIDKTKHDSSRFAATWNLSISGRQMFTTMDPSEYLQHGTSYGSVGKKRSDGSYKIIEALFGPMISDISHVSAVASGAIAPIEVRRVRNAGTPRTFNSVYQVSRYGIWQNGERNAAIAEAVRRLETEGFEKILIMTQTTEHAYILRQFVPDFTVVHAGVDADMQEKLFKGGYLLPDEDPNTNPDWMREWFRDGEIKKVIATTKWREGVDFPDLGVIIRADAQSGFNLSIQIGGRPGRIFEGKQKGIVVDFADLYGQDLETKSRSRFRNYTEQGWDIVDWFDAP